ncbi:MAG: chromosomal replication initiator protein DnaA [Chloroflexi bacterium]|nr:chromosomal replication initiator protein DnaA [Chloroflexota bacterium]MCC6896552.1 chromosomal replication initiator protein DnaA [Anaerolineae bacterium]
MNPQDAWNSAFSQLEIQLDRASFETWLRGAVFLGCTEDGIYRVGVANTYARDMLQHRLYREIRRVLGDVLGERVELCFEVNKVDPVATADDELPLFRLLNRQPELPPAQVSTPLYQQVSRPQRPDLPESELNPRYTFDRFVNNQSNRMTYEAAMAVAEHPSTQYNPFFVYGGVGLGKTHLLQSIAHVCRSRGMRVIYIPSEVFTNDLVDAIRQRTTAMFREKYRSADVLLVDDIQFIAGKESTQEEFFHTFNALYTYNKQVVLASDRPPSELNTLEDRLRSRFGGGLVMDLQPPEFETRVAILRMWAQERSVELPVNAAEMIADKARMNIREMEGVFNQLVATTHLARRPVTVDMAENALAGYRRPRNHQLTMARVLSTTAEYYRLTVADLVGPRRTARLNQARQVAMYLAREVTLASLPQIGDAFGGRTHSTVLHSCNKVAQELAVDDMLREDVAAIQATLHGQD